MGRTAALSLALAATLVVAAREWGHRSAPLAPWAEAASPAAGTNEAKVILLEPVGMTCPMCQQFAGAGRYGGFGGFETAPHLSSLEEWIFKMDRSKDRIVLAGGPAFLQPAHYQASYDLVPGLQLIDKGFVLRWDGTGHRPRHSWWRDVLPHLPTLMTE